MKKVTLKFKVEAKFGILLEFIRIVWILNLILNKYIVIKSKHN
jgi:hypothetical protein